ncbi:MAG TPA: G/U mismatch-specific DNA glycosylase [Vicinamibacterales bacterium]|nr:G/U mismatch-specific DNA glycosylase [Vicinamibacterales bacterium]
MAARSRSAAITKRPTAAELKAATGAFIADVISPDLDVLFVGINPGLYSAATGHHFARPGNRFWPALHASGFTSRQLDPSEKNGLLDFGCGITNLVRRATVAADELAPAELRAGRRRLERKVRRNRPRFIAVVGIGAYRVAFDRPDAALGEQAERLAGARVWVLPNTSGLNANHRPADFARMFADLRRAIRRTPRRRTP